jgi:hypothetical protein
MNTGIIKSMLLLDEPNISGLRIGIENTAKGFLFVAFVGALTWEFLTDMKFMGVVKDLVLALVFMGCFYQFHTTAVDLSLTASEALLREVSPRNIFLRKWNEVKVRTTTSTEGSFIDRVAIPNLNDLLGTALFLLSKVCILILKLIYTTVYYFTFIFAPITAVLSFIPTSKSSMTGTITSSLWCILLPFVLVVFLALVGNSVQMPAENGQLAVSSMDQLIWIFGITLLMLLAPSFTYSLIKGSVANTADAVGVKMTGIGAKALVTLPIAYGLAQKVFGKKGSNGGKGNWWNKDKKNNSANSKTSQNFYPNARSYFPNSGTSKNGGKQNYQSAYHEKAGLNFKQSDNKAIKTEKLSEVKTNQQNQNANSISSVATKTSSQTAKIPFGSFKNPAPINSLGKKELIKSNPASSFVSKVFRSSTPQAPVQRANVIKQSMPVKTAMSKSIFPRLAIRDFKPVLTKGRMREV